MSARMTGNIGPQATLRIRRDRSWFGFLVPYGIDVGIRRVGRLWSGGEIERVLDLGEHRVTVWSGGVQVGAETVVVPETGSEYELTRSQPTWRSFLGVGFHQITLRRTDA